MLDEIATKKRKVMLIMQQIKAELGHEAKKRREEDSQTAIASASQKRGAVKGGFLNKKGGKKAPEPPSRMESLKQVFGAHPAVRERNFLCTKNIGIFVGTEPHLTPFSACLCCCVCFPLVLNYSLIHSLFCSFHRGLDFHLPVWRVHGCLIPSRVSP